MNQLRTREQRNEKVVEHYKEGYPIGDVKKILEHKYGHSISPDSLKSLVNRMQRDGIIEGRGKGWVAKKKYEVPS